MCLCFRQFYLNTDRPLHKQETLCALSICNCHPESILDIAKARSRRSGGGREAKLSCSLSDKCTQGRPSWSSILRLQIFLSAPCPSHSHLWTTEIEMFSRKFTADPSSRTYDELVQAKFTHITPVGKRWLTYLTKKQGVGSWWVSPSALISIKEGVKVKPRETPRKSDAMELKDSSCFSQQFEFWFI